MTRPRVVLPQPDSPTSPSVSPLRISKLTSSTALTSATLRWKRMPEVTGKYILTPRTSTRFSPAAGVGVVAACSSVIASSFLGGDGGVVGLHHAFPFPAGG